jgi:hypothetical protein
MTELKQSINIIVNLCDDDRARLDNIIDLLAQLVDGKTATKKDDIAEMCANVLKKSEDSVEPAKNAQEEPKPSDHPTLDPFPETPTAKAEASEAPVEKAKPAVTMAMLTNKALTLSASGKKDQVKEIVHAYAPKVTALPEDKWVEVYEKLTALEG